MRYILHIGAAMQSCRVRLDGRELTHHRGGYLPFEVDLTDTLPAEDRAAILELELDNRWDQSIPPGKKFEELDSCWYGGLYRDVSLRIVPAVHITSPMSAQEIGGGGIFARTLSATAERARLHVRIHVRNTLSQAQLIEPSIKLADTSNHLIVSKNLPPSLIAPHSAQHIESELEVPAPQLWSPESPHLYQLTVTLKDRCGDLVDEAEIGYGIRRISFSKNAGFQINGKRQRLRGTNRLQEHPYVGYAVPRAAHLRDAQRIKEAGFDYIRLSHYPHSPDFLEACDRLGIVVMNCIPGWQFMGDESFRKACFQNARELIRRDRNHPCVVLWELSLNETAMDDAFMDELHRIGHEEYPGDQMFTAGWIDHYDVFIHSRQHGQIHHWQNGDKAMVVAEYGDWEFYANNAGFNQTRRDGLMADWSNSRKDRADGESGMRRQAWNHMVALNDTYASPAVMDGQWAMFDYARGYHPVRAKVGVMDVFRLPKFSYEFYRSQRSPAETGALWHGGPMVFIASHWTPQSERQIMIFSNCDEVELSLNGHTLGRQQAQATIENQYLPHPPFFFCTSAFDPGQLEAIGYIGNKPVAKHRVLTPGSISDLRLQVATMGYLPPADEADLIFVHAQFLDRTGTLCHDSALVVEFSLSDNATMASPQHIAAEAGIATAVVACPQNSNGFVIRARAGDLQAEATYAKTRRPS